MKDTNDKSVSSTAKEESLASEQDNQSCEALKIEMLDSECHTFDDERIYIDEENHQLCATDPQGVPYVIGDELRLKKVVKNLDTQAVKVTIQHITKWVQHELELKLDELRAKKLHEVLLKKGVMVYEACVSDLAYYLFTQVQAYIDTYGYSYEHYRLGWGKNGRDSGFFASKSIKAPYYSILWNNNSHILGASGQQSVYDNMVANEIIPNKSMHLPFVLGFTAPIVPLISKKSDVPVLLINFAGKSSMGKSTSMKLIASIWGKGIISNSRLSVCKTFSCTDNGFEAAVNANKGIPALFDDFQAAAKQTYFSDLIYRLTQGESKIRCNKKGQLMDTYSWSTFIGFTGEHSIFDFLDDNLGLKARIVQFQNVEWTASEKNVANINSVIGDNCGFYGEWFVSQLMQKSEDDLYKYFEDSKAEINKLLPTTDNVVKRLQNRIALIRMTAVLVKELINPGIDVDYITNFLVDNEKKREAELDIFEDARERLVEFINRNLPNFVMRGSEVQSVTIPNSRIVGRIYTGRQGKLIAVLPDEFKKIMMHFGDHDLILEKWRDSGFLVTESKDRFTKKVKISNYTVAPRCYVFLFEDFETLFGKLLKEEEIDIQTLEEEDFVANLEKDPKNVVYRRDPGNKKIKFKYVKVPDQPPVELPAPRAGKKADEGFIPVTVPTDVQSETPVCETKYDDEEAIKAIFEDSDDDKEDSDEED